jgi:transposase
VPLVVQPGEAFQFGWSEDFAILGGERAKQNKSRYKRRNRIEIMFGRLMDWRRVATRHDRRSKVFLSSVALAATVLFWLLNKNES